MTKVKVITRFRDKFDNSVVYMPGQVVEFSDDARVKDLTARGLVEAVGGAKSDVLAAARAIKAAKTAEEAEVAKATQAESEE